VTILEYKFTNDVLFKILFVKYPELLKRLVANMLRVNLNSIDKFLITNPDMPPEVAGEKFCRLDITMTVDGQRIDLEVQVANEGDYKERSLYYWAREYSSALREGEEYSELPRTIVISILAFKLFDCVEYFSEYQVFETTRHTLLTDRLCLLYYELPKLPQIDDEKDELKLWLALFNAKTEEDLLKIATIGGAVMEQAIKAYRQVTATDEFKELERLRSRARHNEASALGHARREEAAKWQGVVAEKDAALADKDAVLADKDEALANKDKQIAALLARLGGDKS
jgi:predicted transposase/invertase (TIGR01784 family)